MGLKLEYIIIAIIVSIIGVVGTLEVRNVKQSKEVAGKELEFTNTTFVEVDTNKTQGTAFGTYGLRIGGVLYVDNLRYHTDSIKLLRARKGRYEGDKVYLDGNVSLNQKIGFDYFAEHAIYDKKREILHIPSKFRAYMNENIFYGKMLVYDVQKKVSLSEDADALLYTAEKQENGTINVEKGTR